MQQGQTRNIFTATSRYAYRQGENFLTEGLAFLFEVLREQEPKALQRFLEQMTGIPLSIDTDSLLITTQENTEQGRPDLAISQKLDFLLYLEVKNHSGLGWQQLERYYDELEKREEAHKQLFLLTRSRAAARSVGLKRDRFTHILWHQVAAWLAALPLQGDVSKYMVQNYVSFLEDNQMSLIQVTNYASGVISMRRMVELIRIALNEVLPGERFGHTNPLHKPWIGYKWRPEEHWLGFYFDKPTVLWLEKGGVEEPRPKLPLDLDEIGFFEMDSGKQLDTLISFITEGVEELNIPRDPPV